MELNERLWGREFQEKLNLDMPQPSQPSVPHRTGKKQTKQITQFKPERVELRQVSACSAQTSQEGCEVLALLDTNTGKPF